MFLKVMLHFLPFFTFSEAFCCVVMDYSDCERFRNVLRHSLISWGFLKHSEAFSWVLSGSKCFLRVLRYYLTFWELWGVLMSTLLLWKVPGNSETFSDILGCFEAFWGVPMGVWKCLWRLRSNVLGWSGVGSERFLMVLKCSLTYWVALRHSEAFS